MARRPPAATRAPRGGRPPRRSAAAAPHASRLPRRAAAPDSRSVWWDLADRSALAPAPSLDAALRCRTAIVGSGIAGLSLAVALARRGDDVVVLERAGPADGATGRNAGFLLCDSECLSLAAEMHGERAALDLRALGLATRVFVETVAGAASSLRRTGSLRLASDAGEARHFERTAARGLPGVRLEDPAACGEGGSLRGWLSALADDGDGTVDPLGLVADLLAEAARLGVRRFDRTPTLALSASPRPRSVLVETPRAALTADRVVVATNADARRLVPGFGRFLRPVRAQALAAHVDPLPRWARPTYATRGGEYWRLLPDGRVLLGGLRRLDLRAENTESRAPTPLHQRALRAFLGRLAGPGARIDVTHRWAGTMGFTRDGVPLVGPVGVARGGRGASARVHLLAGWNGHGMGWAPGAADALAACLQAAGPPAPKTLSPGRANLGRPPGDS